LEVPKKSKKSTRGSANKKNNKKSGLKTLALAYQDMEKMKWIVDKSGNKVYKKVRIPNVLSYEVLINGWPRVFAVTTRDINPGDELLTDNGDSWWRQYRAKWRRWKDINQIKSTELENRCRDIVINQTKLYKENTSALFRWIGEFSTDLLADIPLDIIKLGVDMPLEKLENCTLQEKKIQHKSQQKQNGNEYCFVVDEVDGLFFFSSLFP